MRCQSIRSITGFVILAMALAGSGVSAQASELPPCPKDKKVRWHNCQGTITFAKGGKYAGEFQDDKRHGRGIYTYANGDKYIGAFRDDKRNGHGTFMFASGSKYVGEFLNGDYHGYGTFTYTSGNKYEGEYRNDKKFGQGTFTFKSGRKYVGEFRDGNFNGKGTLYAADGSVSKSGIWADDELVASLEKPGPAVSAAPAIANSSVDARPSRRIALVIGNSKYAHVSVLPNPINDAQALASMLRSVGLQSVTIKTDLNLDQTIAALREFARAADTADWAVVYYSGHGIEYNGVNYMVPIDAQLKVDRDIDLEAVDVGKVLGAIEGAKKLRLVLLDACRDNPFLRQMKRSVATRSLSQGLARIEPEAGTLIVYAAKHGETALDGDGQNSPFAEALLRRLRTPDLEVRRLFDVVRDDVMAATNRRQQPYSYGSLPGSENFFFVAK